MNELSHKLEKAFEDFEALQRELEDTLNMHPEKFTEHLDRWLERYSRQGAILQFLMDNYRMQLGTDIDMAEAKKWQEKLQTTIDNQARLQSIIKKLRDKMQRRLDDMKKGKKLITGYHSGAGVGKPVFLSRDA
jgi:DNA repair exonuclease SbcCD ATPase subunit